MLAGMKNMLAFVVFALAALGIRSAPAAAKRSQEPGRYRHPLGERRGAGPEAFHGHVWRRGGVHAVCNTAVLAFPPRLDAHEGDALEPIPQFHGDRGGIKYGTC